MRKKAGQNDGSVFERKDGRYVAQVTVQGKQISKYFKTRKEAKEWKKQTLAQIDDGLNLLAAQCTIGQYLQDWLNTIQTSVRPRTTEQYIQVVNQHIMPVFGRLKLKDLRPEQVQSFYNAKIKDGASARTVLLIHAVFHRALEQALKYGLINRNPLDAVTRPKLRRKEMKTLNDIQVRTLLQAAQGNRLETLYWFAVTTGLRQGELIGLKWSDLDWNNKRLRIQRQVQRQKNKGLVFSEPKTNAGRRIIVLGSSTIEKLREHYQRQPLERQFAGIYWVENDLIFPNSHGNPLEPSNLLKDFKNLLKIAGLPDIRFHDLRHTAATLMLQQNTHPKVVQERLGHSDISLTLNTYSHVLPGMQEEAAEKLDELITLVSIKIETPFTKASVQEERENDKIL